LPRFDRRESAPEDGEDLSPAQGILSVGLDTVVCMREHPAAVLIAQATQLLDDAGRIPLTGLSGAEPDAVIEDGLTAMSRLRVHVVGAVEQAEAIDPPAELAAPSMVAWLRAGSG